MSKTHSHRGGALLSLRPLVAKASAEEAEPSKGFGGGPKTGKRQGKGHKRKGTGLGAADRSPLGKAPDLEALRARKLLGLPLAGRLSQGQVKVAYKALAAEHHPDQGGHMETMQTINRAKDLLLGTDN